MTSIKLPRNGFTTAMIDFVRLIVVLLFCRPQLGYAQVSSESRLAEIPNQYCTPDLLGEQAVVALNNMDYDKGIDLLRKAISCNEGDEGANYDPWVVAGTDRNGVGPTTLARDVTENQLARQRRAYQHGCEQVQAMLSDRPLMRSHLLASDELWKWAARKYSIRILGSEINWDPSPTVLPDITAEHSPPRPGLPGRIRLNDLETDNIAHQAIAFEILWSCAAFELHNIEYARQSQHLADQVRLDNITEDEFVRSMCLLEMKAIQRTRKWYVEVFLPHAKKYTLRTNPAIWYCDRWGSIESLCSQYTDKKSYPWEPYARYYLELKTASTELR